MRHWPAPPSDTPQAAAAEPHGGAGRRISIEQAVESYPDVDDIPRRNIETLKKLGLQGWARQLATGKA